MTDAGHTPDETGRRLRELFADGVRSGAIQRTDEPILRDLRFTVEEWVDLPYTMRDYYRWLCWKEAS